MKLRDELMALEKGSWDFMRDKNIEACATSWATTRC